MIEKRGNGWLGQVQGYSGAINSEWSTKRDASVLVSWAWLKPFQHEAVTIAANAACFIGIAKWLRWLFMFKLP
jgi:hypothetical protein